MFEDISSDRLDDQFDRETLEVILTDPDYNYSEFQTGPDESENALQVDVDSGSVTIREWSPIPESDGELLLSTARTNLADLLDPDAVHRGSYYSGDTGSDWTDVADYLETDRTKQAVEAIRNAAISYVAYWGGEEETVSTIERIDTELPDAAESGLTTLSGIDRHDLYDNAYSPDVMDRLIDVHPGFDHDKAGLSHQTANRVVSRILNQNLELFQYNRSTEQWEDVQFTTDQHDHKVLAALPNDRHPFYSENLGVQYNDALYERMLDHLESQFESDPEFARTVKEWLITKEIENEWPDAADEFFESVRSDLQEIVNDFDETVVDSFLEKLDADSNPDLKYNKTFDQSEEPADPKDPKVTVDPDLS